MLLKFCIVIISFVCVSGQYYEDRRCRCVCPSPATVLNSTLRTDRKLFIADVPPNKCNCDGVILPRVGDEIKGHEQEFCPRCECKYETRNTTVIMVVVIIVLWLLMLLCVYMVFLICLDPLIKKKPSRHYRERGTEEDDSKMRTNKSLAHRLAVIILAALLVIFIIHSLCILYFTRVKRCKRN